MYIIQVYVCIIGMVITMYDTWIIYVHYMYVLLVW